MRSGATISSPVMCDGSAVWFGIWLRSTLALIGGKTQGHFTVEDRCSD